MNSIHDWHRLAASGHIAVYFTTPPHLLRHTFALTPLVVADTRQQLQPIPAFLLPSRHWALRTKRRRRLCRGSYERREPVYIPVQFSVGGTGVKLTPCQTRPSTVRILCGKPLSVASRIGYFELSLFSCLVQRACLNAGIVRRSISSQYAPRLSPRMPNLCELYTNILAGLPVPS